MRDGLSQMKTTCLLRDQKGYLWIGTRNGLNRFDGERFEVFTKDDGLLHNRIHELELTSSGNIIALTFEGVNVFDGQKFQSYPHQFSNVLYQSLVDKKDILWILENRSGRLIKFDPSSNPVYSSVSTHQDLKIFPSLHYDPHNDFKYIVTRDSIYVYDNDWIKTLPLKNKASDRRQQTLKSVSNHFYDFQGNLYFLKDTTVTLEPNKSSIQSNPSTILQQLEGPKGNDILTPIPYLESIADDLVRPTEVIYDQDSSLWVATENGLVHIPYPAIWTLSSKDAPYIWIVAGYEEDQKNYIFLGSYGYGLFRFSEDSSELVHHNDVVDLYHAASASSPEGTTILGTHNGFYILGEDREVKVSNTVFCADYDPINNQFVLGVIGGILITSDLENFEFYGAENGLHETNYIQSISIDQNGYYWLGSYEGLSRFDWNSKSFKNYIQSANNLPSQGVFASFQDDNKTLWLGGDQGLMTYDYEKDSIINVYSELINTGIKSITRFNDRQILVGAKDGLFLVDIYHYKEQERLNTSVIAHSHGYSGIDPGFNGFYTDSKNRIWVTSATDVNIIDPKYIKSFGSSLIANIVSLDYQKLPYDRLDSIFEISSGKDYIHVGIDAIGLHRPTQTKFQTKLDDQMWTDWFIEDQFTINDLTHGHHTLQVRAGPADLSSPDYQHDQIDFIVSIPIYQRSWFFPAFLILLTGLLFWTSWSWWKSKIAQQKYQSQLVRSKYLRNQLLLAELNPHFIFNVLSSIHHKILTNKRKEASTYLLKLSDIVRSFLNSTHQSSNLDDIYDMDISLPKELDLLQSFIEFEQINSDFHFDFSISTVPHNMQWQNVYLPPMIVQPFVENAIKHGILLSEKKGKLTVEFTKTFDALICQIKDDGVGRKQSTQIYRSMKSKGRSLGNQIVKERIDLLNEMGHKIELVIEDNDPSGTIVTITIFDETI